jgi:DNA-binding response OmpR family regulator
MRILVVGTPSRGTQSILSRLASCGWGSRTVETLREAEVLVNTFRFDMVLATESLPDGRAYAMTQAIARRSGTLIVAIALSESCLWLPVVEQGRRVLGTRALRPEQLEREAEKILRASDPKQLRALAADVGPSPRRAGIPRRKSPAA